MKKVKMLVNTAYKGPRKEGDIVSVPDDFAERWVKNHIAVAYESDSEVEGAAESGITETVSEDEVEVESGDESSLSEMSAKELYALCKEKGIEADAKKSKEYYLDKLEGKNE